MVPIAHGNDGGGSIRIPAACCGVVGLKTARGRVSAGPESGQSFLSCDGMLSRTIEDTAAALDVLAGYEPGDATWAPPPPASYSELAAAAPGRLRIGVTVTPPLDDVEVDPVCEAAVRDAAELLASLGHEVEPASPPWSGLDMLPDFTRAFGPQISMTTLVGGRLAGREPTEDDVEPLTWLMYCHARDTNALSLLSSQGRLEGVARSLIAYMSRYDAILTPALAQRPVPIGTINGFVGPDPWVGYRRSGYFTPFTAIVNITGQPAISLPLYHGDDGLPTAVQLIGRPAREEVLLSIATQLESSLPWAGREPPALAV
jgi:amidase